MKLGKHGLKYINPITGKYDFKKYRKDYKLKNKEALEKYFKEYRLNNKEKIREGNKSYRLKNKEQIKKMKRKWYDENKPHCRQKNILWKLKNPGKYYLYGKKSGLKIKYGITLEQYYDMIKNQNNKCFICSIEFDKNIKYKKPHIDHDHQTNKVRSLLCLHCNTTIGYAKENINTLSNMVDYLKEHKNDGQLEEMGIKGKAREIEEHNRLSESTQKEIKKLNIEIKRSQSIIDKWMKVLKEKARRYDLMRFALRKTENKV
jgi:hypothetical protein